MDEWHLQKNPAYGWRVEVAKREPSVVVVDFIDLVSAWDRLRLACNAFAERLAD